MKAPVAPDEALSADALGPVAVDLEKKAKLDEALEGARKTILNALDEK